MFNDENNPLAEFNDTSTLYKEIKAYLSGNYQGKPRITKDTPYPTVAMWINRCVRRFLWKNKSSKTIIYLEEKIIYLSFKFLEEIDYPN